VEEESGIDTQSQLIDPAPGSAFNGASDIGLVGTQHFTPVKDAETTSSYDRLPEMSKLELLQGSPGTCISDLMCADLYVHGNVPNLLLAFLIECRDQTYFDRVHTFAPILHQGRYFSWARQPTKSEHRSCLQYAMWTLAASLSAQFQQIRDSLYRDARRMLEALDLKDNEMDSIDVEQVQAWILLAIYEFMRTNYRRGWKSAGRAFRLVQLMRLYGVDAPHSPTIGQGNGSVQADWIETEEERRTFWMAYILDRFVSIRNEWPLTINEQMVRLTPPSPPSQSCLSS
jgi:Fungal specific transcription factor domain